MKSEEYWARRMEDLNEAELRKGEEYIRTQNAEYDKAMARLKKETEAWYSRLAKNNDISMAAARKLLTANELKEFRWDVQDYIKAGRENAVDQRWVKELENASAKVHITRLEELQTKMRQEVELLAAKRQKGTTDVMGDIYKDSYYKSVFEVQRGVGEGIPFAKLDTKQIDKVLTKPWAPDGRNFSSRIWADRDKLLAELQTVLTQDLIRGEDSEKTISDFAARMGVSKSAAERLIITEAAYFSGQSRIDGYKETGVKHYQFVATLDRRTSEQCRRMDGEVIPLSEAKAGVNYPPLHAYCRSTTIPHFDDTAEPGERAARSDENGKTYQVPGNMTYKEWAAKHAPKDATTPPDGDSPRPQDPPKVIPVTPSDPPAPAITLKEAEDAARNYGFDEVDYTGLDLDSANAVNGAIDKALREFPSLKGFAKKISALDDEGFVAQAEMRLEGEALHANLKVSSHYFNSTDIDGIIKESVAVNYWPLGSNKQSLFIHEFGHLAEYTHAMKLLGTWTGIPLSADEAQIVYMRIQRGALSSAIITEALENLELEYLADVIRDELSDYANTSTRETLAEAFAEAAGTENPRRLASEIMRILKRKMREVGL
jgi:SPP1 gp7 family putative phage head morphogenesis protein